MLRLLTLLFTLLLLGVLALPVVAVLLAVSDKPIITAAGDLDFRDVERAQSLLAQNDPRRMPPGSTQTLTLSEEDINLMLRYGLKRLGGGAAAVRLDPGEATLSLAALLPQNPLGQWLNIRAALRQRGSRLSVQQLDIGRLQVPGPVADWLLQLGDRQLRRDALYRAVLNSISDLDLSRDSLAITYLWRPELVDQVRSRGTSVLISPEDRERLLVYARHIAALSADPTLRHGVSLDRFMVPLFALAASRSGDASAESRALLAALAIYVNGLNLERLVKLPPGERYRPRWLGVTLGGRRDLAQHFSLSAALAAAGGSPLADAVGLSKEVRDITHGSGFSFTDLAADRAGVRFAEVATGSTARRTQRRLAAGQGESDYMPMMKGLPEFMGADSFARRYGSVGSPAYRAVAADIERRISALPVHQR